MKRSVRQSICVRICNPQAALAIAITMAFFVDVALLYGQETKPADVVRAPNAGWTADWQATDNLELVERIRKKILVLQGDLAEGDMADYEGEIKVSGVAFDMVKIPGGEFLMGSPSDEAGRLEDEGPQRKMKIAPFWMGKYEVTWDQFTPFAGAWKVRVEGDQSKEKSSESELWDLGAVTGPSEFYAGDPSYGMGTDGFPAVCMTQYSASKFCQWLSAQTGHYYRLPTEAEWEYACRAGTTSAYHFGDDPNLLEKYAVFDPQLERVGYARVGTKKPNRWGLYDMHGNVLEFCLDQYFADSYRVKRDTIPAKKLYPRVMRGGSWYDDAPAFLRAAKRDFTNKNFKNSDPMSPKSLWWLPDAPWLGFRIVRPLEIPDAKTMHALWNSGAILEK